MPKRSRRLLTPSKHKASKQIAKKEIIEEENEDKGLYIKLFFYSFDRADGYY